jgi:O-antigen ligase
MHVAAGLAWSLAQSISNAAEGITWGVLLAVALARLPKIHRAFVPVLRDPLMLSLLGWAGWTAVGASWAPNLGPGYPGAMPERWVITPLMLWPLMARPWLVLGAMLAGGTVHVALALAWSWTGTGWVAPHAVQSLSNFGQLQWQLHTVVVLAAHAVRHLRWPGKAMWAMPAAAAAWLIVLSARRAAVVGMLIGVWCVATRPHLGRAARGVAIVTVLVLAAAGWWIAVESPVANRLRTSADLAMRMDDDGMEDLALGRLTSERATLALAAFDIALEHPWLGGGRGWFTAQLPRWAMAQMAEDSRRIAPLERYLQGSLTDAHNLFLQWWVDGGIPGAVLVSFPVLALGWRLWRQSAFDPTSAAAMALYVAILVGSVTGIVTAKAPGAIIAVCLAVSWRWPSRPRARILLQEP